MFYNEKINNVYFEKIKAYIFLIKIKYISQA